MQLFLVNPVVETGRSGIWTYRKYADGTLEAWGTTGSVAVTGLAATGNNFFKFMDIATMPEFVMEVNCINVTPRSGDLWVANVQANTSTKKVSAMMMRSINVDINIVLSVQIVGKWK